MIPIKIASLFGIFYEKQKNRKPPQSKGLRFFCHFRLFITELFQGFSKGGVLYFWILLKSV